MNNFEILGCWPSRSHTCGTREHAHHIPYGTRQLDEDGTDSAGREQEGRLKHVVDSEGFGGGTNGGTVIGYDGNGLAATYDA